MSQELVRQLLIEEGGEATIDELRQLAKERYPDRTLSKYMSDRLQSLSKKGFVTKVDGPEAVWRITERGENTKTGNLPIYELEDDTSVEKFDKYNITISNIVAGFDLGSELNLERISEEFGDTRYHPESNNRLSFSPFEQKSLKLIAPSTGRISIVGAKNTDDLIEARDEFLHLLEDEFIDTPEIVVQNVVGTTSLNRELDLKELAASGGNLFEYSPENFPGLIFRPHNGATILIFTSGKCVITGAKTYSQVVESYEELIGVLRNVGVQDVGVSEW